MGEIVIGILLIALCLLIYFNSGDFPQINETVLDPGSYPKLIAASLIILSLILILKEAIHWIKTKADHSKMGFRHYLKKQWDEYDLVVFTAIILAFYVFFMDMLGFILSSIAFIIVSGLLIGPRKKKDVITISLISLIVTIGLYFFFENALHVRFPTGILF